MVWDMQANITFLILFCLSIKIPEPTAILFCQEEMYQNEKLQIKFIEFSF